MNKKLIKLLSIVFICIVVILVIYKIDSVSQTKERIVNTAKHLMESISNDDYDKIRTYIKKYDGSELSDQEISNFLLNTGLYRLIFINDEKPSFVYSTNVNFFNTNKGTILFNYKALDGDLITNEIDYLNTGINEYFITNDTEESGKIINRYPFDKDLANGEEITHSKDDKSEIDETLAYQFIKDENGIFYIQIVEEAKEDIRISMFNMLDKNLKNKENEYRYEWNEDCSIVSVYYNSAKELSYIKNLHIITTSLLCSTTIQALNKNPDWHLNINYYDYNTEELLKTEIIR